MTIELIIVIAAVVIVAGYVCFEAIKNRKEAKLNSGPVPTDGGNDPDGRGDKVEGSVAPAAFSIPLNAANMLNTTPSTVVKNAAVKKAVTKKVPTKKKPTKKAVVKKKILTKTTKR